MSIIAVANQKGGVAKTTTVHTLSTALSRRGRRVLMVDLDPQACLTYAAGVDPDALDSTIHDVMLGRAKVDEIIIDIDEVSLAPSCVDLAGSEVHLLAKTGREFVLRKALQPFVGDYDYVFIDCGPSLGLLTVNALTAATHVVIPFQAETLSQRGVGQLLETISDVRYYTNDHLIVLGAVATIFDGRTKLARKVLDSVPETHGIQILPPPIPKSVRVAEAPETGTSILDHATNSKSAAAYRELAATLEERV